MIDNPALAFDREPQPGESARRYDIYGRLHVASAHISKAAVNTYFGREIPGWQSLGLDQDRAYKLFRDPDELAAAADSFNNVPLMRRHVAHTAADHKPDLVIGSTGTDAKFEFPFLDNSLVVWPAADIEKIEEGLKKELSCSYAYTPDMTPGAFQGESYDGRMTRIIANHVSLVIAGRAGSEVAIGDSDIITGQWRQIERALLTAYGPTRAFDAWNESDHPRGQPENAGEFGPGGGSTKEESAAIKTAKPYKAGLKAHGAEWATERKKVWRTVAPDDVDKLIANSPKNQAALADVCDKVAAEVGIKFKNPGVKSEEGIHKKIASGKTVQEVNDAVRGGFDTPTPESSEKILRALAKKFEVADEGWTVTPQGYFDRKVMVRFEDGQIGEVQMWAPGMLEAKEGSGQGHVYYKQYGSEKDPEKRAALSDKMNALYKSVQDKLDPTWSSIFRPNQP